MSAGRRKPHIRDKAVPEVYSCSSLVIELSETCLCGKTATATAYFPTNVWARLRQITGKQRVCSYHAEKARKMGYRVEQ